MSGLDYGWRAHFADEWQRQGYTLHLWRPRGDRIEVAHGELLVTDHDAAAIAEPSGVFLSAGVYEAIVAAIDPPAHGAELRRLEEALAIERRRVDDVLRAVASPSSAEGDAE